MKLHICCVDGTDLVAMDVNGKSDPYVIVSVGRQQLRTSVQYKTLTPTWNDELVFDAVRPADVVKLAVWDEDHFTLDDFMGLAEIALGDLALDTATEKTLVLAPRPNKKDKVTGSIRVRVLLTEDESSATMLDHVFGVPIDKLVNCETGELPRVFETCVSFIEEFAHDEEGIFRLSGSSSKLQDLQKQFDESKEVDLNVPAYKGDPHVVAGLIKLFLRKLPEPLLTNSLYPEFVKPDASGFRRVQELIAQLPPANTLVLRRLLKMLAKVRDAHATNKMTASNLAIVFGPNLLSTDSLDALQDTPQINKTVTVIIERAEDLLSDTKTEENAVVVIWDYEARTETEISLKAGARVSTTEFKEGWANVTTADGAAGWFPANYLSMN